MLNNSSYDIEGSQYHRASPPDPSGDKYAAAKLHLFFVLFKGLITKMKSRNETFICARCRNEIQNCEYGSHDNYPNAPPYFPIILVPPCKTCEEDAREKEKILNDIKQIN